MDKGIIHTITEEAQERLKAAAHEVFICAVTSLKEAGRIPPGGVVVLGCSTSEVLGGTIGHASVPEAGAIIAQAFMAACGAQQLHPAFQCCEHLNRALVVDAALVKPLCLTQVNAIPQPKAGGSVPAAAWQQLPHPALVHAIQADAAIDVGDTFVGMHIRPVAVPLRIAHHRLGEAHLTLAYSRLPYIGGSRAVYQTTENPAQTG